MEAHASDEWPLGKKRSFIQQHQTIGARIEAAKHYRSIRMNAELAKNDLNVQVASQAAFACDTMENKFYKVFGAWPEGHIVMDTNFKLVVSTETVHGTGEIKGGFWWEVIESALLNKLGLTKK